MTLARTHDIQAASRAVLATLAGAAHSQRHPLESAEFSTALEQLESMLTAAPRSDEALTRTAIETAA
ncbi:hypothetical protein [Streptomyces clavifer]|uniref:hypothetical protein n=1 Tax=Streptomyces clavifer TaxID=68188 RepID=UPI00364833E9